MAKQPTMTIQEAEGLLADLDRLEQWLAERPDRRFDYLDPDNCVLCQYLKAHGAPETTHFGGTEFGLSKANWSGTIPDLARDAVAWCWTFGEVLGKLQKLRARGAKEAKP